MNKILKFFSLFFIASTLLLYGCSSSDLSEGSENQPQEELGTAEYNLANSTKGSQTNQIEVQDIENGDGNSEVQDIEQESEKIDLSDEENQITANVEENDGAQVAEIERPPVDPSKGFSAPEFSLTTLTGSNITLSDLRGKNVVLNYWKSWCVPCMDELVALENLHRTYQGENLFILSVNGIEDDSLEDVNRTVNEKGLTFPVILDHGETFWKSYQVLFLPTSFFIDKQGVIRDIAIGGDSEADFKLRIEQLLADEL
jgi:peroxiredoxin